MKNSINQPNQFTCLMHPEVVKDAPGKCPKCGMDLVPISNSTSEHEVHQHHASQESEHGQHRMKVEKHAKHRHQHSGHSGHANHAGMIDDYKKRFYIVLVMTIPIMALSPMIQHWLRVNWMFAGSSYLLMLLSSVVYFYGGWPFLIGLKDEVKSKSPGMMTLVAVAITVAYVYSVAIILGLEGMDFFWELATLILIMLLGHWIEMKSIMGASRELELLVQLMPSEAHLVEGDQIKEIKTEDLQTGNIILIKPGEKIAADGMITDGNSYLNESMLTGESKPVQKQKGDKVIGLAGQPIQFFAEMGNILQQNKNKEIDIQLLRNNTDTIASKVKIGDDGLLKVAAKDITTYFKIEKKEYNLLTCFPAGVVHSWHILRDYVKQFRIIFSPELKGYKQLGGFAAISKLYPDTWNWLAFWTPSRVNPG